MRTKVRERGRGGGVRRGRVVDYAKRFRKDHKVPWRRLGTNKVVKDSGVSGLSGRSVCGEDGSDAPEKKHVRI